jgi:isoleucyl-tRNA synthetase
MSELSDNAAMGRDYWQQIMAVRAAVNREIETQRSAGNLRGSLDADIVLYASEQLQAVLQQLGDELRFVLITSNAEVKSLDAAPDSAADTELEQLRLQIRISSNEKCERCWHRRPEVGSISAHSTLCQRCVENIEGSGEQRQFA